MRTDKYGEQYPDPNKLRQHSGESVGVRMAAKIRKLLSRVPFIAIKDPATGRAAFVHPMQPCEAGFMHGYVYGYGPIKFTEAYVARAEQWPDRIMPSVDPRWLRVRSDNTVYQAQRTGSKK